MINIQFPSTRWHSRQVSQLIKYWACISWETSQQRGPSTKAVTKKETIRWYRSDYHRMLREASCFFDHIHVFINRDKFANGPYEVTQYKYCCLCFFMLQWCAVTDTCFPLRCSTRMTINCWKHYHNKSNVCFSLLMRFVLYTFWFWLRKSLANHIRILVCFSSDCLL